jgi:8-oxo-dGTP pyrophosphatase MutT (NUDIX family)
MTSAGTSANKTSTNNAGSLEYTVVIAVRGEGNEKEFLLVRHRDRGWELPGGKLEGSEGPVHCALREFREETGHTLDEPHFVMKLQRKNGTCYVFRGGLGPKVQEVHENEAVMALRWCRRLPPNDSLAFPDDPYEEIGQEMGLVFR